MVSVVYVWDPSSEQADGFGHAAMQVGNDCYISYWPSKSSEEQNKNAKGDQGQKRLSVHSIEHTFSYNYDEDCKHIGRLAEYSVYI